MIKMTSYQLDAPIKRPLRIALAADLHNTCGEETVGLLRQANPDIIAACGDFLIRPYDESLDGLHFLESAAAIAPTFFVLGNHENRMTDSDLQLVRNLGVTPLLNEAVEIYGVLLGGIDPVRVYGGGYFSPTPPLDPEFINAFQAMPGYKILLSHYPDYYADHVKQLDIPLMLSGHTHGGQINLFHRGLYAAGQGLFPRYFAGAYDNRLVISRGLSNRIGYQVRGLTGIIARHIPRILNPIELVLIELVPREG